MYGQRRRRWGSIVVPSKTVSFRYHSVWQLIRGIVQAADGINAGHAETLAQLQLWFKKERKVKAVSSTASLSKEGLWVFEMESALEAKLLELQPLPGTASESSNLRAKGTRLGVSSRRLVVRSEIW